MRQLQTRSSRSTRRLLSAFVAAAVVLAACGGGSDSSPASVSDRPDDVAASSPNPANGSDIEIPAELADSSMFQEAKTLTDTAIDNLGSEDAAVEAILRAADSGYDFQQISAAITADALSSAGTITGVEPANPATSLIIGFRRSATDEQQIEDLKKAAKAGPGNFVGADGGALYILVMISFGFPFSAIVEALVLGFELGSYPCANNASQNCLPPDCTNYLIIGKDARGPIGCPVPAFGTVEVTGEVVSGELVEAVMVTSIGENSLDFSIDFETGLVTGSGIVVRSLTMSSTPDEECEGVAFDTPIDMTFDGVFFNDTGEMTGDVAWELEVFVADECRDNLFDRSGTMSGTWEATWDDPDLVGTITLETMGTSEFEAQTP